MGCLSNSCAFELTGDGVQRAGEFCGCTGRLEERCGFDIGGRMFTFVLCLMRSGMILIRFIRPVGVRPIGILGFFIN